MPSDLPKNILKLVAALLKHQAKLWLGEEAVGIAGETLVEIGGEEVQKKLDELLSTKDGGAELLKAAQHANDYFQQHCKDDHLRQALTLSFGDLVSIQEALADLPEAMDTSQVEGAIQSALMRDIPSLTLTQATQGARLYTESLQRALLPAKDFTLPIIGQTVLDNKNKLMELGYDQKEILATLQRIEMRLAQLPSFLPGPTLPGSLPPGSYMPFLRNTNFTGRDNDLQSLEDSLLKDKPTSTVISQSVTGMGGIGKTQLAVEFAWRYGYRFKGVHWLDLRDPQALDGAIALCSTPMGFAFVDQREQVATTLGTWIADGPRLLILDNFEDVKRSNEVLVRFQHPSLRLLVTSRRKDFPKSAALRMQELGLFSETESLDFLEKTLEQAETSQARIVLAEKLGHLPLALELAANYINISRISIQRYLQELADALRHESMQAEWFQELEVTNPTKHDQSLFGTFQLSWREVQDEMQQKIFMIAGYCAPNTPIPLEIFKKTLDLEDKALSKAIYRLNALGLLPTANGLPSIHPLLATYARTLGLSSEDLLEKLAHQLSWLARTAHDQVKDSGNLVQFVPLGSHIRSVAEFAEEARVPYAADLLSHLGSYMHIIANYQGAKAAFERAIKINEGVFGPNHPNVGIDLNNLGSVLREMSDLAGAKTVLESALKIAEESYGSNHPNVAFCLNNVGMLLKDMGDLAGAKATHERALKIDEAAYGSDHPTVATSVNNLGNVLRDLGDMSGAKTTFERAAKIDEKTFGPNHPNVGRDLNNLGTVLQDLGDLPGAKAAFERVLQIAEKTYGSNHPRVATSVNNLGAVLRDLGDLPGAQTAFKHAHKIDETVFGPNHPNVARDLNNLSAVLRDLGDLSAAKTALERVLQIDEAVFGADHTDVARDLNNLGVVLMDLGEFLGARAALERALRIREKYLPAGHPKIRLVQENLATLSKKE